MTGAADLVPVFLVLARLAGLAGALLLLPLAVGLASGETETGLVLAFAGPAVLSFALYLGARRATRGGRPQLRTPLQGFLCVVFGWLTFAGLGALPYWISGALPGPVDAFFESMSGFTTTGASVFRSVMELPRALLFWRALTQFVGGLGIIALFVAILPALGAGGVVLFRSEVSAKVLEDRLRPRIQDTAKFLWYIYAGLCLAEFLILMGCGLTPFDALCHAFTTVSTGGFSTNDQSAAAFPPVAQWVIILFMFLAGVSFLLHGKALQGNVKAYVRSEEFLLYLGILLAATGLITSVLLVHGQPAAGAVVVPGLLDPATHAPGFFTALRDAAFQATSIMTCTGYASTDYDRWADSCRFVLLALMLAGGCSGSTSGGVKVFRLLFLFRAIGRQLALLLSPSRVLTVRFGDTSVGENALLAAALLFILYVLTILFGGLLLMLLGVPMVESLSATLTCLSCCGPGLGAVGPAGNFADLTALAKLVLTLVMLMGRLELYAILVLLALPRVKRV